MSEDGLVWTVRLRDDVHFGSTGDRLTAAQITSDSERAKVLGLGARELLHKPVTMAQLVGEMRKHLDR